MPVYEYNCGHCSAVVEKFYPIIPKEVEEQFIGQCPQCREVTTFTKIVSSNSFQLKGDGWEKDGYTKP